MARAVVLAALSSLALVACDGRIGALDDEGGGARSDAGTGGDSEATARARFASDVQPMLQLACSACHSNSDALGFLRADPDVYGSVMAHPNLVIGGDPDASRLYSYGRSPQHSGIELTSEQAEVVRQWIEIVPRAGGDDPAAISDHIQPRFGGQDNTVELAALGAGLEGATLSFQADQLAQGIYIKKLALHAGGAGLHVVHPLFVSYCPKTIPDPVDSFDGLDQVVNPGETAELGSGTVVLVDFVPGCELSVNFQKIEPGQAGPLPDGGVGPGPGGGCVNVPGFTADARPELQSRCASCHAGGQAAARNAFDLSSIGDASEAGQKAACGQTRNKIDRDQEADSLLFKRVAPGQQTGHPVTLSATQFAAFRDAVTAWAVTE